MIITRRPESSEQRQRRARRGPAAPIDRLAFDRDWSGTVAHLWAESALRSCPAGSIANAGLRWCGASRHQPNGDLDAEACQEVQVPRQNFIQVQVPACRGDATFAGACAADSPSFWRSFKKDRELQAGAGDRDAAIGVGRDDRCAERINKELIAARLRPFHAADISVFQTGINGGLGSVALSSSRPRWPADDFLLQHARCEHFVSVTQQFNITTSRGGSRSTCCCRLPNSSARSPPSGSGTKLPPPSARVCGSAAWRRSGYDTRDRKITVNEAEAERVRTIFESYLELGSLNLVMADLRKRGIVTKVRTLRTGETVGGIAFTRGPLAHLLRNRFYIGEVAFKGEVLAGEQPAIIDRDLFDAVQARLSEQVTNHKVSRTGSEALLLGRIVDDRGHRMSPSHVRKRAIKYRYYLSSALTQGRPKQAGTVTGFRHERSKPSSPMPFEITLAPWDRGHSPYQHPCRPG